MKFIKMHGLGNDFIVIDCLGGEKIEMSGEKAEMLCDRHFGIGADGVVIMEKSDSADLFMHIINSDGSLAKMCGNAIRCVSKYVFEKCGKTDITVDTLGGRKLIHVNTENGRFVSARVNMGRPRCIGSMDYKINGATAQFMRVDTGNPHVVTYSVYPEKNDFLKYGLAISAHPLLVDGANVEFVKLKDRQHIEIEVYERGAGPTLACGTGATASFFAGYKTGLLDKKIYARLPGGVLEFDINENDEVFMTGPASTAFTGETEI